MHVHCRSTNRLRGAAGMSTNSWVSKTIGTTVLRFGLQSQILRMQLSKGASSKLCACSGSAKGFVLWLLLVQPVL